MCGGHRVVLLPEVCRNLLLVADFLLRDLLPLFAL